MMPIFYENSKGVKLDLLHGNYRLQTGDIFDYDWSYASLSSNKGNGLITRFTKSIKQKKLTLTIKGQNEADYRIALNDFFETVDYDVMQMKYGKLWVGDYYMLCYVLASKKTEWEYGIEALDNEITIVTDRPFWIQERMYGFAKQYYDDVSTESSIGDYPFDFKRTIGKDILPNLSFTDSDFILTIYGFVDEPTITIAGHPYTVHTMLYDGERLVIDNRAGTVLKVGRLGEVTDIYNSREKIYSVFKKIPQGIQPVRWSGGFTFEITLFDERSEPKWSL